MSVTVSIPATSEPLSTGNTKLTVRDVVFDSGYPTGGEPLTAADLGLSQVIAACATVKVAGTGSVTAVYYDIPTAKLLAYTAAAEAGAVDLSAVTAQVLAFGK